MMSTQYSFFTSPRTNKKKRDLERERHKWYSGFLHGIDNYFFSFSLVFTPKNILINTLYSNASSFLESSSISGYTSSKICNRHWNEGKRKEKWNILYVQLPVKYSVAINLPFLLISLKEIENMLIDVYYFMSIRQVNVNAVSLFNLLFWHYILRITKDN